MKFRLSELLLVLGATLLFCLPAFINGYPLVYSDTGTYIFSGFAGHVPADRPITYGLFLRHTSLAFSVWLTVFSQGLLYALLIFFLLRKSGIGDSIFNRVYLIATLVLTVFSTLPWFSSFLMADALTGAAFLIIFLLLTFPPGYSIGFALMALIWMFFASTHLTNLPAALAALTGLSLLKLIPHMRSKLPLWKSFLRVWMVLVLGFSFLPTVNWFFTGSFNGSRAGYVHLTSRLVENGSLKQYLDKHCGDANFKLCAYKDSLPSTASDFLWLTNSPLYRLGGWEANGEEYQLLNKAILSDPEYLGIYLQYYLRVCLRQLWLHRVGEEFLVFLDDSPPGWELKNHFGEEHNQFLNSAQAKGLWQNHLNDINNLLLVVLLIAMGICFISLFVPNVSNYSKFATIAFLFYYTGNLMAVSIASSGSRYNSRLDWIWVLLALLTFVRSQKIGSQ